MSDFKRTAVLEYPSIGQPQTVDTLYWKHLEFPITKKEHGPISHIEFSPIEPYNYAVTASIRVKIHSSYDNEVVKTLGHFQQLAYSGSYRKDGQLLVAGGDEGYLRLFEVAGGKFLRMFQGHRQAVHVSRFLSDNYRVMSGSDDKTVRIWDIASQSELSQYTDNTDYVRSGACSPSSKDVVVTGCYDHKIRLYDTRTAQSAMLIMDHGHPVESVVIFPTGGVVISAGGTDVKVWDILSGGRLLATCSNHHKTVTALAFCSNYQRLLSGSVDRHVKIYDVGTYQAVHSLDYPSAILSLGVSPDDSLIAVGMADGLLSIQKRRNQSEVEMEKIEKRQARLKKTSYQYRLPALSHSAREEDAVIKHVAKMKLEKYDQYLKRFEHTKALDAAMDIRLRSSKPHVTISIMQELLRRNALKPALAGRDNKSLIAILKFLQKNISNRKLTNTVVDVSNMVLDLYKDELGQCTEVDDVLLQLKHSVQIEVEYMEQCMELMGVLEALFASSQSLAPKSTPKEALPMETITNTS